MKSPMTYSIYVKNKCLFSQISEDEFEMTWKTLNNLISVLDTDYKKEDLFFEKIND